MREKLNENPVAAGGAHRRARRSSSASCCSTRRSSGGPEAPAPSSRGLQARTPAPAADAPAGAAGVDRRRRRPAPADAGSAHRRARTQRATTRRRRRRVRRRARPAQGRGRRLSRPTRSSRCWSSASIRRTASSPRRSDCAGSTIRAGQIVDELRSRSTPPSSSSRPSDIAATRGSRRASTSTAPRRWSSIAAQAPDRGAAAHRDGQLRLPRPGERRPGGRRRALRGSRRTSRTTR